MSDTGQLLSSCDSIFSTEKFIQKNVTEWSSFITSILDAIVRLQLEKILVMPCIHFVVNHVEGVFDCLFESQTDKHNIVTIVLRIKDITRIAQRRRAAQQLSYPLN